MIPASIISFVVKEKQIAMKHQQLVSGVSLRAYWVSHFLTDFVRNLVPSFWSVAMIQAFGVASLTDWYGSACAIFFLFGWAIGPFCYLMSFLFEFEGTNIYRCRQRYVGHLLHQYGAGCDHPSGGVHPETDIEHSLGWCGHRMGDAYLPLLLLRPRRRRHLPSEGSPTVTITCYFLD